MITPSVIDRFLAGARGQALREGTRYAREARVGGFVGSTESATTVVRGATDDFEVVLWPEEGRLAHRCSCPSWRDPCKHEVAAALVLRQCLAVLPEKDADAGGPAAPRSGGTGEERDSGAPLSRLARRAAAPSIALPDPESLTLPDPEEARERALEERRVAARREKLTVSLDAPPLLRVGSASGFAYRVHLRGGVEAPHACDCPDFEANRLHTCKHVERARTWLRATARRLPPPHRREAARPRVYLHFGEVIEPRLLGRPSGPGAPAVREAFDERGIPVRPLARDPLELLDWLRRLGSWVEPEALSWLEDRAQRKPALPAPDVRRLLPPLPLAPYPYQWDGASFLANSGRALLADEMGLGKTVQALLAAAALEKAQPPAEHVTIVCPASLRGGWQEEIRRWLGQEATLLEGPTLERTRVIASRPRWLVTHYEQVLRDHLHHAAHPPDLLIVDEAQRAKGLRARTARALKAIPSRYLFALTGTPLENRMEEAYAIAQLVDQRLLPPLWQLDRDHFVRDRKGRRVVLYRNLDALRSRLAPAFLRRRKEDVALELPDRVRSIVNVPMHPAVSDTYESVMQSAAQIAAKKVILPADLERMQRLLVIARRCCDGPHMLRIKPRGRGDAAIPKLEELEQSLRDLCLGEGRKAVVFSEWTDMTEPVETMCARLRLPAFHLHGQVPVKERPALIRAFTGADGPAVFVSTDAGGVGLNLQAADVVVNLDLPWNPARLEQRIARVHRIGSRRTVQEILIVCKDSVEERILHLHATKRNVLENVWAKGGEDVIAAPGGSGSFQEMVRALIATRGPAPADPEAPAAAAAVESEADGSGHGLESRASIEAAPMEGLSERTGGALPASVPSPADHTTGSDRTAADRVAAEPTQTTASPPSQTPEESATPSAPDLARHASVADGARAPSSAGVDPASVARAVAAVAPSLPAEHRRSLATVFRALAEALEA